MVCYGRHAAYADYWWLLPVLGTGTGLLFVPAVITLVGRAPAVHAGTASAVVDTLREVGGVVGVAALGAVLTARMRGSLHDRATGAGLTPDAADHLVRTVVTDGSAPGSGTSHVTAWAGDAFVDGLHLALRCGALTLACTLALVLILLAYRRARVRPG